jgi:homocitrate synthase NifV
MGLKHACGIDAGIDTHRFVEISRFVAKASQRPVPAWKPVVGERVFSHESGLHADGVLKDPRNYEGFDPAEVGLNRCLVVGKHSGTSGLVERYREMGIAVSRKEALSMMEQVRAIAQRMKRSLNDADLLRLYKSGKLKKAA